jgi:hypothetical protein
MFTAAPQWWLGAFAGPTLNWAPWQQAIGSSYVFFAALILLLAACGQLTPSTTTARTASDPGHSPLMQSSSNRETAIQDRLPPAYPFSLTAVGYESTRRAPV